MPKKDFYDILGINKNASEADIKSAYRKMALKFHPDRNKESNAEEHFKEINEAYEVLSNPQKKNAYDQFGHAAFDPGAPGGSGFGGHTYTNQQGPFNFTWSNMGQPGEQADFDFEGFSNPFDIFEQFFGGGGGGIFGQQAHRAKQLQRYKIQITFQEAALGCTKEFVVDGSKKKVTIPAGISDGQQIRFQDFILYIDVLPDPRFQRDGNDLYIIQNINLKQAILGCELDIQTLTGPLKIKVKPGTQPNTLVRLRGQGIQDVNGRSQGDLYIRLAVVIPEHLSREQKNLLDQLDF